MSDILDAIFRVVRLESCVYFQRDFHAPWGMRIGPTGMAQFHLVIDGACVAETATGVTHATAGDVLFFPRGMAHVLADRPGRPAMLGAEAMASFATAAPMFANGGAPTRLICGHYAYRQRPAHPLFDGLPDVVRVRGGDLQPVAELLMAETDIDAQGSQPVVERLAEVLLVRTLRTWLAQSPPPPRFLHGLADPRLSRALARIHRDFDRALTLEDLAGDAGMSRSSFAERFKEVTGLAAIEYLSRWRMLSAGTLLEETSLSVAEVAARSGYGSEMAFARAFKRLSGRTPAEWRRSGDGVHGARMAAV